MVMDVAIWSALSAIFGGVLLKVAEGFFTDNIKRRDDLTKFRGELQFEIQEKNEEIRKLRYELDALQERYYELKVEQVKMESEIITLRARVAQNG